MPRNIIKDLRDDRRREIERACSIQDRIEAHIRGGAEREAERLRSWVLPWICGDESNVYYNAVEDWGINWPQFTKPVVRYPHGYKGTRS